MALAQQFCDRFLKEGPNDTKSLARKPTKEDGVCGRHPWKRDDVLYTEYAFTDDSKIITGGGDVLVLSRTPATL